jgi:ribosomal protein S18 acetylase RimI-like enzyme
MAAQLFALLLGVRLRAMTFLSRRFAGSSDIPLLVDWVRAVRPREHVTDYPSVIDLPQLLLLPHNQQTIRVWFAENGELLGFAFVDAFRTLRFELDWQQTTLALEAAVVAWGNNCLSNTAAAAQPSTLYATAHQADTVRLAYLDRQGFIRLADSIVHLERSLATPIAAPQLPAGFTMRPVEGEHEAAELAVLHRDAFGTPHMTAERRLALMRTAHYDPALDLVIITSEGVRAAYGMGSVSPEENAVTGRNACYADLFATHPAYRGRGLARSLLVTVLQLLQARGFATAKLNTSSENAPMQQVATSEGFQKVSTTLQFARSLHST